MTALDIGVVMVTVFFLVRGAWIGFVRQLAFLAALLLGYLAAGRYYPDLSQRLTAIGNPQLRFVLTYALLFLATYVLTMLLGVGLKKVMQVTFLGWFDRLLGASFGLLKAGFLATLVFMALTGILSDRSPVIEKAWVSPYLDISAKWLASIIKDRNLRQELLPHQPAITDFLPGPAPAPPPKPGL